MRRQSTESDTVRGTSRRTYRRTARAGWGWLAAAALALGATVAATPVAAADEPDPGLTVSDVSFSQAAVTVSGFQTVGVQMSVTAQQKPGFDDQHLVVALGPTSGVARRWDNQVVLTRSSGNATNGSYTGTVKVPSTAAGVLRVTHAHLGTCTGDCDYTGLKVDGVGGTLTVTGAQVPSFRAGSSPKPLHILAPSYQLWARVLNSATGKPYPTPGRVAYSSDNMCLEAGSGVTRVPNGKGYVLFPMVKGEALPWSNKVSVRCLRLLATDGTQMDDRMIDLDLMTSLSAVPTKTKVAKNTVVAVVGSVAGKPATCTVSLQRATKSSWVTVGTASVGASGKYKAYAQPKSKGVWTYRARFNAPCAGIEVPSTSKKFTIKAT